jgi:hypothetical protein
MRFQPIDPGPDFRRRRNILRQGQGGLHTTQYHGFNYIELILMGVKDQFVMNLQEHS